MLILTTRIGESLIIEALLRGALRAGTKGVNILVHGEPGTGKTEFCRSLAQRLDVTLYTVGESDDEGGEPTRRERLQELRLAQRLLFDEMEDLLADHVGFRWLGIDVPTLPCPHEN